ncbi:MAG: DNA topoisomerase VI subunit B [Candidatus Thorarchaeota archaeon]
MLSPKSQSQDIVELSVSAWFYRNRTIAGFDNPARSLYVSIREIVENSLDACEDSGILPEVTVLLRQQDDEIDAYDLLSAGPQVFELTVKDNGKGMRREAIPVLIGKMLTGTKFSYRQSRGTFGLGGSLALLYGQVTTQQPIEVITGERGASHGHRVLMRLNIENNTPEVLEEEKIPKSPQESGTMVSFHLQGDWLRSKRRIIDYFSQTAMVVPYASLLFETPDGDVLRFDRLIDTMPEPPREMKPHPRGIDVEMLKSMIAVTKRRTLGAFMKGSFQRVGSATASDFLQGLGLSDGLDPKRLSQDQMVRLMNAMAAYPKFLPPSAKSLSPAGVDVLEAGIRRLSPEHVVFRQRSPSVHEGHPFVVETVVAYGGDITPGIKIFRFANRIPLLYDERSDVTYSVVRTLNLRNYGLRQEDPLAFVMHICSTKIPYKTVGKEYIGDVDVVRREIDLGFKDCLRELGKHVKRRERAKLSLRRQSRLVSYYRFIGETLEGAIGRAVSLERLPVFEGGDSE